MSKTSITITLDEVDLKFFRRGLARGADQGHLNRQYALSRICQLDTLWRTAQDAQERKEGQLVMGVAGQRYEV